MLKPHQLYQYQRQAILHQLYHDQSMLWLDMGLGKQQPLSEPVLTSNGWVDMGDIHIGMEVIGQNGLSTKVIGVFPQGECKVVQVEFNDGSKTRCGWEHLWKVYTDKDRHTKKEGKVMTSGELVDSGLLSKNGKNGYMLKWSIPMMDAVHFSEKEFIVEPYLLGAWLGDGSSGKTTGLTICTDDEIIHRCNLDILRYHKTSKYTAYASLKGLNSQFRTLNLMGKRSWEKHIPDEYLLGSIEQRLSLLQGLLDTDGSAIVGGGVEFSSTSENLTDGVVALAQSLGGIGRKKGPRITHYQGGEGRPSWRVNVKLPSKFTPFRLTRKLNKWVRPSKYQVMRKIKSISEVQSEQSQCIMVEDKEHLYVTKDYIVTHNTIVTLSSIVHRQQTGQVEKVLVFGPLRVIHSVWEKEARKWEHTKHLRFSLVTGTVKQREQGMVNPADIYLCNYENMCWLAEYLLIHYINVKRPLPFQMAVYDEVSKLKNPATKRMKGGKVERKDCRGLPIEIKVIGWNKIMKHFQFTTGLTGTPASNGYMDLFGQYLAIDGGERLGEYITHFRNNYFESDYMGWSYTPTEQGKKWIEHKISDITIKMDAKDYLDMPAVKVSNIMVDLPSKVIPRYKEIEKEMFTQLDTGTEVEVFSASSVSNKLLQFCNGSIYYDDKRSWEAVHDVKLKALEDVLEEAAGKPVLCSYSFKSDAERIMSKFKKLKPVNLTATKSSETGRVLSDWNNGRIKLMIGHPLSIGHGIDSLQDSGSIVVWFGINWSLELYEQLNKRIDRHGQTKSVSIIRILCNDTVDLAVADSINSKDSSQQGLKNSIQRYRDSKIDLT